MAAVNSPALEELLTCSVCFEKYTETGSHTPKIFPCSHTCCAECVEKVLANPSRKACPVCTHDLSGVKSEDLIGDLTTVKLISASASLQGASQSQETDTWENKSCYFIL